MTKPKRRRSALESFDGCPWRYKQLYHGGVEDRGDESQRGIAFHECTFRYIDRLAQAQLPSDAEEADLAFQEGIALTQLPFHLVDHVARLWRPFVEWFELDLSAYLSAEERQQTERFTWIPDLVYVRPQGIEITDWKTYYKGLTLEQALKEFQLKFYLVQALDIWPGFSTYTFTFNFVRLRYAVTVTLTPEQVEAFRPEVEAIVLAMDEAERTDNYPAIPGSHCTLCRLNCPIVDNPQRLPIRFTTVEQAREAAGNILVLEQRLKVLKKSLNGWCSQEGPLLLKGQEFAHRSQVSLRYPLPVVLANIREDQQGQITVSPSATKTIWRKPDNVPTAVLGAAIRKQTWPFRHKKAGEQPKEVEQRTDLLQDDEDDDGTED